MPRWRLFCHLVWATRDRAPLIDAETARPIERSIRATSHNERAIVHGVGIMPDHVHVAVSIPPSSAISPFVGRVKGSASHLVNRTNRPNAPEPFAWQAEYGILSFGEKALPDVVAYVENQEARHASDSLSAALEPTADRPQPQRGFVGSARGLGCLGTSPAPQKTARQEPHPPERP